MSRRDTVFSRRNGDGIDIVVLGCMAGTYIRLGGNEWKVMLKEFLAPKCVGEQTDPHLVIN